MKRRKNNMKVLCNAERCVYWKELEEPVPFPRPGVGKPYDFDKCYGYCTRDVIGIDFKVVYSSQAKYDVPVCRLYGSKDWPTGHMDWSRYPQGGSI